MIDEKIILQVLAEQQEEIKSYKPQRWVSRKEESLFEFDTNMAQVVTVMVMSTWMMTDWQK